MAVDMFIQIGDIKGESQDDAHKDEIDVVSWIWGIEVSDIEVVNTIQGYPSGECKLRSGSWTPVATKSTDSISSHGGDSPAGINLANPVVVEVSNIEIVNTIQGYPTRVPKPRTSSRTSVAQKAAGAQ